MHIFYRDYPWVDTKERVEELHKEMIEQISQMGLLLDQENPVDVYVP